MTALHRCSSCGHENAPGQRFCTSCGASLGGECPTCGSANPPGSRFCGSCGAVLERAPARQAGEERRLATVLFADISEFTHLSEQKDPEDLRAIVDGCMEKLAAIVERYDGFVDKVIGDAVMAVFGAPIAHGDDPERAVRAALEMQRCAAEDAAELALSLCVGINTGDVYFAPVGPDARPTVMGDAVNTAKRLQSHAPPKGVYVGEETWRATHRAIEYAEVGPVVAKGKDKPLRVFTPVGERSAPAEATFPAVPLLGRDHELDLLRGVWNRVAGGNRPHLVTVFGPPGIGKTRVASELVANVEELGGRALRGRSVPFAETTGFGAFGQQVKQLAGIFESDPVPVARSKLDGIVARVLGVTEAQELSSQLAALIGLAVDDAPVEKHVLFRAARRFVEGLGREAPTVLVFEDIHWADPSLLELLEHLATRLRDVPVLLLTLARSELLELRPTWGGGLPAYTALPLEPLAPEISRELVVRLLAQRTEASVAVAERLSETAEGNPLFIEELAASFLERAASSDDQLPSTVKGIIAARLDALPPAERATILDAAVVGKVFWRGALAHLGGDAGLAEILDSLEQRNLIRHEQSSRIEGEDQFSFRHMLIREVAYATLPKAVRRERHAAVARFLEQAAGDRAAESAASLAHHWEQAGDRGRAGDYLVKAAEQAERAWAKQAAASFYTRALEVLPEDDTARLRAIRLRRAAAMVQAGNFHAAVPELDALIGELEGRERFEALEARFKATFWGLNDAEASRRFGAQALQLANELGDDELRALALSRQAAALAMDGQVDEAIALSTDGLAAWRPDVRPAERAEALDWRSLHHYWLGKYEEALEPGREAVRVGSEIQSVFGVVNGHADLGLSLTGLGRHEEALAVFERGVAHGRELELQPRLTSRILNMWAGALREVFELEEARRLNEEAIELGERIAFPGAVVSGKIDLVALDLLEGEIGRAEKALPALRARAAETKGWHQWLWTTRIAYAEAEVALASGRPGDAVTLASDAVAHALSYRRLKYVASARAVLG
ncbi:MAG: AAA family ATPase, partial [Actinomycetota bacterium]|nr:AAA family ATPase [Actinomycetota bacterium]